MVCEVPIVFHSSHPIFRQPTAGPIDALSSALQNLTHQPQTQNLDENPQEFGVARLSALGELALGNRRLIIGGNPQDAYYRTRIAHAPMGRLNGAGADGQEQLAPPEISSVKICCLFNRIESSGLMSLSEDVSHDKLLSDHALEERNRNFRDSLPKGEYFRAVKVGMLGTTVALFRGRKYLLVTPFNSPVSDVLQKHSEIDSEDQQQASKRYRAHSRSRSMERRPARRRLRTRSSSSSHSSTPRYRSISRTRDHRAPSADEKGKQKAIPGIEFKPPRTQHDSYPFDRFESRLLKESSERRGRCGLYELRRVVDVDTLSIDEFQSRRDLFLVCMPDYEPEVDEESHIPSQNQDQKSNETNDTEILQKAGKDDFVDEFDGDEEQNDPGPSTRPLHTTRPKVTSSEQLEPAPTVVPPTELKDKNRRPRATSPATCRCEVARRKSVMHMELIARHLSDRITSIRSIVRARSRPVAHQNIQEQKLGNWNFLDILSGSAESLLSNLFSASTEEPLVGQVDILPTPVSADAQDQSTEVTPTQKQKEPISEEDLQSVADIFRLYFDLILKLRLIKSIKQREGRLAREPNGRREQTRRESRTGAARQTRVQARQRQNQRVVTANSDDNVAPAPAWHVVKMSYSEQVGNLHLPPTSIAELSLPTSTAPHSSTETVNDSATELMVVHVLKYYGLQSQDRIKLNEELGNRISQLSQDKTKAKARIRLLETIKEMVKTMQRTFNRQTTREQDGTNDEASESQQSNSTPLNRPATTRPSVQTVLPMRASLPVLASEIIAEKENLDQLQLMLEAYNRSSLCLMEMSRLISNYGLDIGPHYMAGFGTDEDARIGQELFQSGIERMVSPLQSSTTTTTITSSS